jgi:hypothetical protein
MKKPKINACPMTGAEKECVMRKHAHVKVALTHQETILGLDLERPDFD